MDRKVVSVGWHIYDRFLCAVTKSASDGSPLANRLIH
jgi:hypothetical protein